MRKGEERGDAVINSAHLENSWVREGESVCCTAQRDALCTHDHKRGTHDRHASCFSPHAPPPPPPLPLASFSAAGHRRHLLLLFPTRQNTQSRLRPKRPSVPISVGSPCLCISSCLRAGTKQARSLKEEGKEGAAKTGENYAAVCLLYKRLPPLAVLFRGVLFLPSFTI